MSQERIVISAKLQRDLVERVKKDEVPLSRIIEAGVAYYDGLSKEEKKEFLLNHTPGLGATNTLNEIRENIGLVPLSVVGFALGSALGIGGAGAATAKSIAKRRGRTKKS